MDFLHLWSAFNEVRDDEEVIVFWVKSDLRKSARLILEDHAEDGGVDLPEGGVRVDDRPELQA
jgi:hypothetical protein